MKVTVKEMNAALGLLELPVCADQFDEYDRLLADKLKVWINHCLQNRIQEIDLGWKLENVAAYIKRLSEAHSKMHKQRLFANNRR
jgi:hypothetical protein